MPRPLLTRTQREQLLANGRCTAQGEELDPLPVVKLFMPDGPGTWLLTELDPAQSTRAFGLCDLGLGSPELGYVDLTELAAPRGRLHLPIERDIHFRATRSLSVYAAEARVKGKITA